MLPFNALSLDLDLSTSSFEQALQRGRSRGIAVVCMEDQWLLSALADPLPQSGPAYQISCGGLILTLGEITGHCLAGPDNACKV